MNVINQYKDLIIFLYCMWIETDFFKVFVACEIRKCCPAMFVEFRQGGVIHSRQLLLVSAERLVSSANYTVSHKLK